MKTVYDCGAEDAATRSDTDTNTIVIHTGFVDYDCTKRGALMHELGHLSGGCRELR